MKIEAKKGKVAWQSPSNIAIVKYWGKHGNQLPNNPSLSLSLSKSVSLMEVEYDLNPERKALELDFLFEGKKEKNFELKVKTYLEKNESDFPYLSCLKLSIKSKNSFPHSAGIASSASSMSALALCLARMEDENFVGFKTDEQFKTRASHLARLASGSAARSIYGGLSCWGESESVTGSSDYFAVPVSQGIHESFLTMQNAILLVDSSKKAVSSTMGHKLMVDHPQAEMRYFQAREHIEQLKPIMEKGDISGFGKILEKEALSLHALMMTSEPSYILMKGNTLNLIERIQEIREKEGIPWYFTLDAGPNVHLLYPLDWAKKAEKWIKEELSPFTEKGQIIYDQVGKGPEEMTK